MHAGSENSLCPLSSPIGLERELKSVFGCVCGHMDSVGAEKQWEKTDWGLPAALVSGLGA